MVSYKKESINETRRAQRKHRTKKKETGIQMKIVGRLIK
jgi:hypothetical protein